MARANWQAGKRRSDSVRSAGKKLASIAALFFVGCGGVSAPSGTATVAEAPTRTATTQKPVSTTKISAQPAPTDEPTDGSEKRVAVRTDAKGRKWLGDVPYDVFFDDPLAVAAEGLPSAGAANSGTVAAAPANASVTAKIPHTDAAPAVALRKSQATAEKPAAGSKH